MPNTAVAATPDGQEPGTGQPQAGEPTQPAGTGQEPPPAAPDPRPATSPEELLAQIAELRRENAAHRTENKKLKDAQQAAEDAKLSELERTTKRNQELEQQVAELEARERDRVIRGTIVEQAAKLGFRDPEMAWRLVDLTRLEYTEDGQPKGVEKALREILERSPYLARQGGPDFGGGNRGSSGSGVDMNALLRRAAGR